MTEFTLERDRRFNIELRLSKRRIRKRKKQALQATSEGQGLQIESVEWSQLASSGFKAD